MTMPQNVQLRELTEEPEQMLGQLLSALAPGVNLGQRQKEGWVNGLLSRVRQGKRLFLIDWEGSKVPRGVSIEGKEIAWTQNGFVTTRTGETIGTYDRLVEFGGPSGNHQQILIYV